MPGGATMLLTCTDLPPSVIERMFVTAQPWSWVLTCDGGRADTPTLQLLGWIQEADGIDELVVLHHTGCNALGPGRNEDDTRAARLRLSGTLDAIRAEVPSLDPACLSGFLYHEARDQLVTCP